MGGAPGSSHRCHQCRQRRKKAKSSSTVGWNSSVKLYTCPGRDLPLDALNLRDQLSESSCPVTSVISDVLASQNHRIFYLSIIDEFRPRCGGGIFSGDRIPTRQPIFSNFALCTRVLIRKTDAAIRILDLSLLALLTSYYGRLHGKESLIDLAKSCYIRALGDLRQHLESLDYACLTEDAEFRARHLSFLATVSLHMFEDIDRLQYFSTGCMAHLDGAVTIMEIIGPESFRLPDLRSVLCGLRGMAVYVALQRRQPTPLSSRRWIELPFNGHKKTSRDRLIDIALSIPGIVQDLDACVTLQGVCSYTLDSSQNPEREIENVLQVCVSTRSELEVWLADLERENPSPLYWDVRTDDNKDWKPEKAQVFVDPECIPSFKDDFFHLRFPDGQKAGLFMAYWAFHLELLMAMYDICEALGPEGARKLLFTTGLQEDTLKSLIKDMARLVLQSTAYMTSCFEGIISARGPLSVVKRYFERFDVSPPASIKSI